MSTRTSGNRPPRGAVLGLSEGMAAAAGLRRLRKEAGLGQAELGALTGWTVGMVRQRENGALRMTPAEAEAAAAALGTTPAALLAAGRARAEETA